jgi:lipopolysaccharide export system protein LptA
LKKVFLILIVFAFNLSFAQERVQKIKYVHADEHRFDKRIDANAQMMVGDVRFDHEGTILTCDSAVFYQKANLMRAFGNVKINQADTLFMYSQYLEYNGNTKMADAADKVKLIDSKMTLTTDTLKFNRNKQEAFYPSFGTIKDSANTLKSLKGTYYTQDKKFIFTTDVEITNDKYVMNSNHLVYYTELKTVYFYGPSTIKSEENYIYCENGFYDTKNDISYFKDNSYIQYDDQVLIGDSLYYDRNSGFGSATDNIEIKDSTKTIIVRGHYAEYYELKDSAFVTKDALAINASEKDSLYMHGDTLLMVKIPESEDRIIKAFHNVKIFKNDLQGKADSLVYNEGNGVMKLIYNPVLWASKNQLTADTIIVTNNLETEQLDSLKLLNSGFIISNDTLINFNQIKGKNIYGKFVNNELNTISVFGNAETIYFARNEEKELIGINKALSSNMFIRIINNEIEEISFIQEPEAQLNPESEMPENVRLLKGFVWRNEERPQSKDDLFKDKKNFVKPVDTSPPARKESSKKSKGKDVKGQKKPTREEIMKRIPREKK